MEIKSWREVVNKVRNSFKMLNGNSNDYISDRYIMSELQGASLKLIKQSTNVRKLWNSNNLFQSLPCIDMIQVPLAECGSYISSCLISRSLYQLPRISEGTYFNMLIKGILSIDSLSRKFIESDPDRYANSLGLGLQSQQIHYWFQNKYLYISSPDIIKIKLIAHFEEDIPLELLNFPSYCGDTSVTTLKVTSTTGCCGDSSAITNTKDENSINDMSLCCPPNPLDLECTIPGYMEDDVILMTSKKILETFERIPDKNKTSGISKD